MAWTVTETIRAWSTNLYGGEEMIEVKLACASDASGTDTDLSSTAMALIKGSYLYLMKVVPGTGDAAPTAAWDIDIEDENNHHILDTDSNSNSAVTFHAGSNTVGVYPPIGDFNGAKVSVVSATLGNENTADIYLYFVK
jgi:hypothetical protein